MKWSTRQIWYAVVAILTVPALLVNLGLVPFIEDESIRALVALEMKLKGDYLVPTLNDTLYFSKPPLYNWLLNLSYALTGRIDEWSSRLPTVFFTLAMGFLVYRTSRPYFRERHHAILAGLMWLTCGRVLFYDSFLGLIDICYSMVVYALFMVVWHQGQQQRWWRLFCGVYLLGAIAYMLKGLPIVVFIPATLAAYALVRQQWRWLVHPAHIAGMAVMGGIVGGYYYLYSAAAPVTGSIGGLTEQATMRTPLSHDLSAVIKHLFTYPGEYIYHYLPWTLFLLLAVRRDVVSKLKQQPFFYYVAVAFLANILVYWISPGVYARYVLMLVPLTYLVGLYFYEIEDQKPTWRIKVLSKVIMALVVGLPVAAMAALWHPDLQQLPVDSRWVVVGAIALLCLAAYYLYQRQHRPIILVVVLLVLRIGINTVVLPSRAATTYGQVAKQDAVRIGQAYKGKDLHLYKRSKLDYTSSFYLSSTRNQLTTRVYDDLRVGATYIIDTSKYQVPVDLMVVDSIKKREARQTLYLAKKN